MVSLITDKLGRQTLQDADREPLLPEVLNYSHFLVFFRSLSVGRIASRT